MDSAPGEQPNVVDGHLLLPASHETTGSPERSSASRRLSARQSERCSLRELPLCETVTVVLKAHRHLRGELVFCQDDGRMFTRSETNGGLQRACRLAGLRRIGYHVLRHTFASHLAMAGVPLKAIQELLGHATIEMTLRYAHLSPEIRRKAVEALDRAPTVVSGHSGAHRAGTGGGTGAGASDRARTGAQTSVDAGAGEAEAPKQLLTAVPSPAPLPADESRDGGSHV